MQGVEIAAQSTALTTLANREADAYEDLQALISLVPSIKNVPNGNSTTTSVSDGNLANVRDAILDLRVAILKILEENDKMSLNDAVLRTEIDKLKCIVRSVCSQPQRKPRRSSSLVRFWKNPFKTSSYDRLNLD